MIPGRPREICAPDHKNRQSAVSLGPSCKRDHPGGPQTTRFLKLRKHLQIGTPPWHHGTHVTVFEKCGANLAQNMEKMHQFPQLLQL